MIMIMIKSQSKETQRILKPKQEIGLVHVAQRKGRIDTSSCFKNTNQTLFCLLFFCSARSFYFRSEALHVAMLSFPLIMP